MNTKKLKVWTLLGTNLINYSYIYIYFSPQRFSFEASFCAFPFHADI